MTDLLLRDFGYKPKSPAHEPVTEGEIRNEQRKQSFEEWFIVDERNAVMQWLRELVSNVIMANSIYPTNLQELEERRLWQDRAIGCCNALLQELQYAIETLPVDVNKYTCFAKSIQLEISLIKGWRKSDNKYKKSLGDS